MCMVINDGGIMKLSLTDSEFEFIKKHEHLELSPGNMMLLMDSVLSFIKENKTVFLDLYKDNPRING